MTTAPRREVFAWGMYDFANSAFATCVLTAIFPVLFIDHLVMPGGGGSALWGYVVSGSMLISAIAAPFVGAIADTGAAKKRFLLIFWIAGLLATSLLGIYASGLWVPAAALFIIANVGFASGNALYNSFLPEISTKETIDRASAVGFGMGYVGGGACLAICFVLITKWGAVALSFAMVGLWWFLFSLPFFLVVRERATAVLIKGPSLAYGFKKVRGTLRRIRQYPELAKFLLAFLLYNDGVQTVIFMAAIFGRQTLQMSPGSLALMILVIQGVALVGSFVFAFLAERMGSKRAIVLALLVWCAVIVWAYLLQTEKEFWVLGVVVGMVS